MGRISRYKKIKSCDPFYKGPKKEAIPKLRDFPGKNFKPDEQEIPRAARDLLRRQQMLKNHGLKKKKCENKKQDSKKFQRIQGESTKTYFNRIDHIAADEIAKSLKESKRIREGRKKHLKERKEKLKEKKKSSDYVSGFDTMKDNVRFGEVVMQPPCLTAKPRKAAQTNQGVKSLLLHSLVTPETKEAGNDESLDVNAFERDTGLPKTKKRKHMSPLEQEKADKERERAIMAYRMLRRQRIQEKKEPS